MAQTIQRKNNTAIRLYIYFALILIQTGCFSSSRVVLKPADASKSNGILFQGVYRSTSEQLKRFDLNKHFYLIKFYEGLMDSYRGLAFRDTLVEYGIEAKQSMYLIHEMEYKTGTITGQLFFPEQKEILNFEYCPCGCTKVKLSREGVYEEESLLLSLQKGNSIDELNLPNIQSLFNSKYHKPKEIKYIVHKVSFDAENIFVECRFYSVGS